jgi:hypothetical protein
LRRVCRATVSLLADLDGCSKMSCGLGLDAPQGTHASRPAEPQMVSSITALCRAGEEDALCEATRFFRGPRLVGPRTLHTHTPRDALKRHVTIPTPAPFPFAQSRWPLPSCRTPSPDHRQPGPAAPARPCAIRSAPGARPRGPHPCASTGGGPATLTPVAGAACFEELAAGQQRKYIMISGKVGARGVAQLWPPRLGGQLGVGLIPLLFQALASRPLPDPGTPF